MLAAATALDLAATGQINPDGRLADAIQPYRVQHVYDGDRPAAPSAWKLLTAQLEDVLVQAKTDAAIARELLVLLTSNARTHTTFQRHRLALFGAGIPGAYLPNATELGRTDLT